MPAPKPIPGVGGPPICLDQAVVAAAAADRVLRADRLVHELEGRARVVVEPAHERRHELGSATPSASRWLAHPREVLAQASQSDSPIFGASASDLPARARS